MKSIFDQFFGLLKDVDAKILVVAGKSPKLLRDEMYEELFLLSQSSCDDEILFTPDQNNVLSRWDQGPRCKEYGIVGIEEQDSKKNPFVQVMDILAGITLFLREHHGTYLIWSQSTDRYEQMEDFQRELHIRCELVSYFFGLVEKHYGPVSITEQGVWSVKSERVVVLEY